MTRYVVNSAEVYHLWAQQDQGSAKNNTGTVSFSGNAALSYGEVIGRIATNGNGQRAYLVSNRTFSVTTTRHQRLLRRAIPGGSVVFACYVLPSSESGYGRVLDVMISELPEMLTRAKRARVNKELLVKQLQDNIRMVNAFAEFFGIGHKAIPSDSIECIDAWVKRNQENAEERRAVREDKAIANWLNYVETPNDIEVLAERPFKLLRLKPGMEDFLQSSDGYTAPTHEVKSVIGRLLRVMKICRGKKVEWTHTSDIPAYIGPYEIRGVDRNGGLTVGCQKFTIDEVERFAGVLGVREEDAPQATESQVEPEVV